MSDTVRYRHNVMKVNSIVFFSNVRGGFQNNCRDVYFIRALGVSETALQEIGSVDRALKDRSSRGELIYKRIENLPVLSSQDDVDFYSNSYRTWIRSEKTRVQVKAACSGSFGRVLARACKDLLEKYRHGRSSFSESMERNYIIKLLYRLDKLFDRELETWSEKSNIKVIAGNVEKEQDYLFFYFLTLLGADVLLLQMKGDISLGKEFLMLSEELHLGAFRSIELTSVVLEERRETVSNKRLIEEKRQVSNPIFSFKKTEIPKEKKTGSASDQSDVSQSSGTGKEERIEKSFEELAKLASSVVMIGVHNEKGEVVVTGSGIMVGRRGYILTNHHVVSKGMFYSVRIEEEDNIYETDEVIKYHALTDLAIIRINRNLTPLPVYKGEKKLVRGQKVVAIGSPLGFFNSVSDGIISGFRVIDSIDMIQFTAPISHGSSGGAVLNLYGELIGISTAGVDSGQNINLAVLYKEINPFIRGFE